MAFFYGSVYKDAQQVPIDLPYQTFRVAVGATDAPSPVIDPHPDGNQIPYVRFVSDVDLQYERGAPTPTVVAASEFLPAGSVEYLSMAPGLLFVVRDPFT